MDLFTLVGKIAIDSKEAEDKIDALLTKAGQLNTALGGISGSVSTGTPGSTTSTKDETNTSDSTTAQDVAKGTAVGILISKGIDLLGGWIVDWAKEGYNFEKEREKYIADIQTMMGSTKEEAEAFFDELNQLSISTPLNMSSIGDATNRFLALGFEADTLMERFQVLGDLARGDNFTFLRAVKAFSDTYGKSGLKAQEKNQFAETGIPILGLLAELYDAPYSTQKEKDAFNEMMLNTMEKGGMISPEDVWAAFVKATEEGGRFFKAMEIAQGTLAGQTEKGEEMFAMVGGKLLRKSGLINIPKWLIGRKNSLLEETNELLDNPDALKETPEMQKVMDIIDAITAPTPTLTDYLNEQKYKEHMEEYSLPEDWQGPIWTPYNGTFIDPMGGMGGGGAVDEIKTAVAQGIAEGLAGVTITTGNVTLNDGTIVARILPRINRGLGNMAMRELRE